MEKSNIYKNSKINRPYEKKAKTEKEAARSPAKYGKPSDKLRKVKVADPFASAKKHKTY